MDMQVEDALFVKQGAIRLDENGHVVVDFTGTFNIEAVHSLLLHEGVDAASRVISNAVMSRVLTAEVIDFYNDQLEAVEESEIDERVATPEERQAVDDHIGNVVAKYNTPTPNAL